MSTLNRLVIPVTVGIVTLHLGCAGSSGQAETERDESSRLAQIDPRIESLPSGMVRFTLGLSSGATNVVYVSLNDEDGQPGWIRVYRGTDRIHLTERCEIENCGQRAVVCGAAVPMIQQIGGNTSSSSVEVLWDGRNSIIDSTSSCEMRRPSPEGEYRASFCYAHEAEFEPTSDPTQPAPGRLLQQTCVERLFILPTS